MEKNIHFYSKVFSRLRVDRAKGLAPHKPILLLSVIELIGQGKIRHNQIPLSPEIIAAFLKYWSPLGTKPYRPDIAPPFFHMKSEGFWHLRAKPGFEAITSSRIRLRTIAALHDAIQYAFLDDELFSLLQIPAARAALVNVLALKWFPHRKADIERMLEINSFQALQNRIQEEGGAVYGPEDLKNEEELVVRSTAFRRIIVSVYEHRCAFCRLQIIDAFGQEVVDGAHIKPFSKFRDNRISNGLSLCKNHHWAFDRGWFAIDEGYRILVSQNLREKSPNAKSANSFHRERILLPVKGIYAPSPESLRWHRENVFNSSGS